MGSLVTSERVGVAAALVTACAAVVIPAILAFEQQETQATHSTIEYYHALFDSPQGRLLDKIAADGEFFFGEEIRVLKRQNEALPEDQRKSDIKLYREVDQAWIAELRKLYGNSKLQALAVFLLKTSDVVYECARFHDLLEDREINGKIFEFVPVKSDISPRLPETSRDYFDILREFVGGFFWTRQTTAQCHQDSVIKLFGRRFSEPFWYLRYYLYCDKFIRGNYFLEEDSDSSPLHRLESVAMVVEQADLEFRYPNKDYFMARTFDQSRSYRKLNPDSITFNFRLEECD